MQKYEMYYCLNFSRENEMQYCIVWNTGNSLVTAEGENTKRKLLLISY